MGCSISPHWALSTRDRTQPGAEIVPKFPSLSHQGWGLERLGGSQEASSPAGDLAQRCRGKAAAQGLLFRGITRCWLMGEEAQSPPLAPMGTWGPGCAREQRLLSRVW